MCQRARIWEGTKPGRWPEQTAVHGVVLSSPSWVEGGGGQMLVAVAFALRSSRHARWGSASRGAAAHLPADGR